MKNDSLRSTENNREMRIRFSFGQKKRLLSNERERERDKKCEELSTINTKHLVFWLGIKWCEKYYSTEFKRVENDFIFGR